MSDGTTKEVEGGWQLVNDQQEEPRFRIIPDAKADDMFWVWESDHKHCAIYTFETIQKYFEGKWEWDPKTNIPFFSKKKET